MKRGESGLSLLVGVNKPVGLSSHDVVNRARRIFEERRVGHTGTLDPLASGVLPLCIGPATRLDAYLVGHEKRYRVEMRFGYETTTDDREGQPTVLGALTPDVRDEAFAARSIAGLVGKHLQVPPRYSAIKVNGQRAYKLARKGQDASLAAREIEVFEAGFVKLVDAGDEVSWTFDALVSKGTYIRSLVRDLGRSLGCPAHLQALTRTQAGAIGLGDCATLDEIADLREQAALDPVRVLGYRFAFADDLGKAIANGSRFGADELSLREYDGSNLLESCSCTSSNHPSASPAADGELVSLVVSNRLSALYAFDASRKTWKPDCVFSTPIARS